MIPVMVKPKLKMHVITMCWHIGPAEYLRYGNGNVWKIGGMLDDYVPSVHHKSLISKC
jgi:hypothetical protein